ncbi:ElaB/YqjD/DUF883 family membrane-anchored ribosome-binding protein [Haloferula luteola]|uniref:ElaB/YqjD/DUF883 family membrane-anchored ribosome-binding protein n=1 Tax=Haloferula luteola TaxID=595692 RepID=A0A840VAC3_9BACT|nr:von Willebrand factor type A domain-containing protein [Haloferula luteola]MBB5352504.1 ElaB/YqjD/DUF883 family membrane-anchored ribosome-binding protein [Haloferula luteola]
MSDQVPPLEPQGDDALEARIVAWVLGEVSAYEAEELQRQCESDPRLEEFAQSMREIDGLIHESARATGEEWRLSEGRRRNVMDRLEEGESRHRLRPRWQRAFLGMAACLLITLVALPVIVRRGTRIPASMRVAEVPATAAWKELKSVREVPRSAGQPVGDLIPQTWSRNREAASKADLLDDGIPPAIAEPMARIVESGNRSGDGAIDRESIAGLLREGSVGWGTLSDDFVDPSLEGEAKKESAPQAEEGTELAELPAMGRLSMDLKNETPVDKFSKGPTLSDPPINEVGLVQKDAGMGGSQGYGWTDTNQGIVSDEAADGDIRRRLDLAQSSFELGLFDDAKEAYESILGEDRYHLAARRGLERVQAAKSQFYRAAYDATRAELLSEVDKAWELEVPTEADVEMSKLQEELISQEDLVEEKRRAMTQLVRTERIPYVPARSDPDSERRKPEIAASRERFAELEAQSLTLQSQMDRLDRSEGQQRLNYAAGILEPESELGTIRSQYQEANQALQSMRDEGRGEESRRLQEQKDLVEDLRGQLDQGVADLRQKLDAHLEESRREMESLKSSVNFDDGHELSKEAFGKLRNDFKMAQDRLEELRARQARLMAEAQSHVVAEARDRIDALSKAAALQTLDSLKESKAAEEPFSTFSLHVSDASFKLAAAALDRGEVPEPASIRPEEFYNAFDYGDPTPGTGDPVGCVIEQAAHPLFPQRNLLRLGVKTGSAGRLPSHPLNLTIMVDNSGSMEREDRRFGLRQAMASLSSLLKVGDTVTLAAFSRQPRLLADRLDGSAAGKLMDAVSTLPSEGGTNLEEALQLAEELASRQFAPGAQNRVVLFTDGAANLGDADPESLHVRVARLRNRGIAFDAVGVGTEGLNDRLLERLSRDGNGRYTVIRDAADAGQEFAEQLAGAFKPAAEDVKVQVKFNPARVGHYRLIGFDEHRLNPEDFRDDTVDAAEMAAEEEGIALYQVEVLPEGSGDVGEVWVRFLDPATGARVERKWSIPFAPQAVAFDQASPSLQLAGLAGLAAEKLRGGGAAEGIDGASLRKVMAEVELAYGRNPRVLELGRMIGQLK